MPSSMTVLVSWQYSNPGEGVQDVFTRSIRSSSGVVRLSVVRLSVVRLSVVRLSVVRLSVVRLSVL
jgi:hypothetical protein